MHFSNPLVLALLSLTTAAAFSNPAETLTTRDAYAYADADADAYPLADPEAYHALHARADYLYKRNLYERDLLPRFPSPGKPDFKITARAMNRAN
jgi:hypothetical protein